ncbi:MAG: hypothetical protein XD78_2252 [Desulfotomaculum sp. 46_296]|nr:MAG: hypothetical protein XD78_2252 [Desulfotomaculum sp. 46_296]
MAVLTGTPVYKNNVRKLEPTDPAAPETWDPIHQDLINNDVYLKQQVDLLYVQTSQGEERRRRTPSLFITRAASPGFSGGK